MRLTQVFATVLAIGAAGVGSSPVTINADPNTIFGGVDMSAQNHYGAPIAPWLHGAKPGWYYGQFPWLWPWLPWLHGPVCSVLPWFPWLIQCPKPWIPPPPPKPHLPPPPPYPWWPWPGHPPPQPPPPPPNDGYHQTFKNLTGATQSQVGDYLTFGLVDTVADCKVMCNSVPECNFANSYNDVNGKDGSTKLTCALYSKCHSDKDATNKGGQTQPDGSINYIRNSDGWCKNGQKPIN
ncbi:hypothetical protein CC1G_09149 [Coprinopsis cinerea okayama7|uniref:Apple domain-containing protein n=1 Tax=Coprinopsis cinerea (strain Okayama-7 / 130 / ATCC MYA-4618 / FGSC 9003) TaxID=240176 RepID=A8P9Q6_COPC7|nr:hypothetical protein CC1G_09149 [Coprinopsis cinerea okayama7\|eukprot:XP_001839815.1 hypothetical protein CC1G_09149 [Coprinopsis cinerea okayama7\